jgi:hypothetical protein
MIPKDHVLRDNRTDSIGLLLAELYQSSPWTKMKAGLRDAVIEALGQSGYVIFKGDYREYHVTQVGQSLLYRVPSKKRGHLGLFHDQIVRIVCVGRVQNGPWSSKRELMAGPCDESQIKLE